MIKTTTRELDQYFYLEREIENLNRKLSSVKEEIEQTTDPSPALIDTYQTIFKLLDRVLSEFNRLGEYMANIENDYIRQLFFLRYVEGLSWKHVAAAAGGNNTAAGVKQACIRYIQKTNKKES